MTENSSIVRGGDRLLWLDRGNVTDEQELVRKVAIYEDRDLDFLRALNTCQDRASLIAAVFPDRNPDRDVVVLRQVEDASAGYPFRVVQLWSVVE